MRSSLLHIIFFSNSFYGLAAMLLAMETVASLGLGSLPIAFYLLLALATTVFYTASYHFDQAPLPGNERAAWVHQHSRTLQLLQWVLSAAALLAGAWLLVHYGSNIGRLRWVDWLLAISIPSVALAYYGLSFPGIFTIRLRRLGFAKPFIIGIVWTGAVTLYPLLMDALVQGKTPVYTKPLAWYTMNNLMFITTLCILFDIKDYAADHNEGLKTFVVQHGLRATLYRIVLPLVVMGIISYVAHWSSRPVSTVSWWVNAVPLMALLLVALSLQRRRSILFYLYVIDGLMVLKALMGLLAARL